MDEDGGRRTQKRLKKGKNKNKGKEVYLQRAAQKEPPSSSLCRVETSGIVEGPWCSSSFAALVGKSGVRICLKGLEVLDS